MARMAESCFYLVLYCKNVHCLLSARGPHGPSAEKAVRVFMYAILCKNSLIIGENPCMDHIVHV